ncbi:hypothetical protein DM860_005326 [Cuscuta australis]|uniref:Retrotransposon Copia-like N-terminal domain-containing protein n=1 Tax=Cuscuta australis TaxID=267555 RepID=A0A328E0H8_9ASTE|nr:hypothetical protein DM860_005326 [Cuscuta australis]
MSISASASVDSGSSPSSDLVRMSASKHFPIKLTKVNFLVWHQQDAILLSALLGSCTDAVQPLISLADTSADAWSRLTRSLASMSRGRIISLKAKFAKNPRGNRTIAAFVIEMTKIAAKLALAQSPVSDEDLAVHIMSQLGDEYAVIYQSLRGRNDCVSIEELTTILEDCERDIQGRTVVAADLVTTANQTQRTRGDRGGAHSGAFYRAGNFGPSRGCHRGRGPPPGGNRGGNVEEDADGGEWVEAGKWVVEKSVLRRGEEGGGFDE